MTLITVPERKRLEAKRRVGAAESVADALRAYARAKRGRFVLFGSYAAGRMRYDSDLDVLVDFAADEAADAWRFVEAACREAAIPSDIHDAATSRPAFVNRVMAEGVVLD